MKKDVKESAKEVRKVLKAAYPGVKFSVRVRRFSGNSAVDVEWTNGPTEMAVSKLTAHLKGWDNGYYNDYISPNRSVSREVMAAAAQAAAAYYGVPIPEVIDDAHPYLTDMTRVDGLGIDPLCDKVHRAAHSTSVYNVNPRDAFKEAYPN